MPLVTLDRVSLAFGHLPLLDSASLQVDPGERVCIIGRNGTGKSTLLQVISGDLEPEQGAIWRQPSLRIGRLAQDAPLDDARPVFDVVAGGLGDLGDLVARYHHAAVAVSEEGNAASLTTLGHLQQVLDERGGWQFEQRVELVLDRLDLPADARVNELSGGWRRRVLLARALVGQPDLLLLDEPTNHLDIESMLWLEAFLIDYPGAVVFVTHDRVFLQRLATRIVELDRGRLTSWSGNYETFLRKKTEWLANEATQQEKFDKKLAEEEAWLRQGIKARRTRNEGRVRGRQGRRPGNAGRRGPLRGLRPAPTRRRERLGVVRLQADAAERSGQVVFELDHVAKAFGDTLVVRDLSLRVMRGDRIGLIGPNGSGKTTLLRLLMGELQPDTGEVRPGANVRMAYYDQQREQLDPERTVVDTVADGHDTVTVNGRTQHVHGYLRDFLFPSARALSPVKALSGGERNRLLLARLFTRPANVLVMDEPTNDLDIETLELLEELLTEWSGTLLLVSHDRAFIDHVVTSTLVFEGNGRVQEYIGGYEDWVRQHGMAQAAVRPHAEPQVLAGRDRGRMSSGSPAAAPVQATAGRKRTFREQREFEQLPARIEALEAEQANLQRAVAHPDFYKESAEHIREMLARLDGLESELVEAYTRWDALDM